MIVLVGFMGAGKTTVGRLVAARLGVPFVDADAEIEAREGLPVPAIFEGYGEEGFRAIEAATIARLLAGPEVVLALGGGALGTEAVRRAIAGHRVVLLDVDLSQALARVGGDPSRPMLRSPDLPGLYAGRQQAYHDAAEVVVRADRTPREVAAEVLTALRRPRPAVEPAQTPDGVGE